MVLYKNIMILGFLAMSISIHPMDSQTTQVHVGRQVSMPEKKLTWWSLFKIFQASTPAVGEVSPPSTAGVPGDTGSREEASETTSDKTESQSYTGWLSSWFFKSSSSTNLNTAVEQVQAVNSQAQPNNQGSDETPESKDTDAPNILSEDQEEKNDKPAVVEHQVGVAEQPSRNLPSLSTRVYESIFGKTKLAQQKRVVPYTKNVEPSAEDEYGRVTEVRGIGKTALLKKYQTDYSKRYAITTYLQRIPVFKSLVAYCIMTDEELQNQAHNKAYERINSDEVRRMAMSEVWSILGQNHPACTKHKDAVEKAIVDHTVSHTWRDVAEEPKAKPESSSETNQESISSDWQIVPRRVDPNTCKKFFEAKAEARYRSYNSKCLLLMQEKQNKELHDSSEGQESISSDWQIVQDDPEKQSVDNPEKQNKHVSYDALLSDKNYEQLARVRICELLSWRAGGRFAKIGKKIQRPSRVGLLGKSVLEQIMYKLIHDDAQKYAKRYIQDKRFAAAEQNKYKTAKTRAIIHDLQIRHHYETRADAWILKHYAETSKKELAEIVTSLKAESLAT